MPDRATVFVTFVGIGLAATMAVMATRRWRLVDRLVDWWFAGYDLMRGRPWTAVVLMGLVAGAAAAPWATSRTGTSNPRVAVLVTGALFVIAAAFVWAIQQRWIGSATPESPAQRDGAESTKRHWASAICLLRERRWLLALPFALAGVSAATSWLSWLLMRPHSRREFGGILGPQYSWWKAFRQSVSWHDISQAARDALRAGAPVSEGLWAAAILLIVGTVFLAKRRAGLGAWLGWAAMLVATAASVSVCLASLKTGVRVPDQLAIAAMGMLADLGAVSLVGGFVLLIVRCAALGRRQSATTLTEKLLRLWPEWFVILFFLWLPFNVVSMCVSVASWQADGGHPWLWFLAHTWWVRRGAVWLGLLLSIAVRFAPYALAKGASSADAAAAESLWLWRTRTSEVIDLLVPLWCAGLLWFVLICPLDVGYGAPIPVVGREVLSWLHLSLHLAFLLFAEIVCLLWYESVSAEEESVVASLSSDAVPANAPGVAPADC